MIFNKEAHKELDMKGIKELAVSGKLEKNNSRTN
jgi:hypothetical protein